MIQVFETGELILNWFGNVWFQTLTSLRGINVNLRHNLIEVKPESKEAVFQHLDTQETVCIETQTNGRLFYQTTGDGALWPAACDPANEHPGPPRHQRQPGRCRRLPWCQQRDPATQQVSADVYDPKPHFNNLSDQLKGSQTSLALATARVYPRPRQQLLWQPSLASSGGRLNLLLLRLIFLIIQKESGRLIEIPASPNQIWRIHKVCSLLQMEFNLPLL